MLCFAHALREITCRHIIQILSRANNKIAMGAKYVSRVFLFIHINDNPFAVKENQQILHACHVLEGGHVWPYKACPAAHEVLPWESDIAEPRVKCWCPVVAPLSVQVAPFTSTLH